MNEFLKFSLTLLVIFPLSVLLIFLNNLFPHMKKPPFMNKISLPIVIIFSVIVSVGIYYFYRENFEITKGKLCRGGNYMFQGNSKLSNMCNELPEEEKCRYQCPKGFHGLPRRNWNYSRECRIRVDD